MDAPGGARKRSFVVPSRGGQDEGAREGRTQRQGHGTSELFQRLCRNSGSNAAAASSDRADSVTRSRSAKVGEPDRMQLSTEPADGMTVPVKMDEKRACPPAQRECTSQEHHPAAVTAGVGENQLPVSNDMFYALLEEAGNRHADGHPCADDDDTPMDEDEDGDRASADLDRTNADRIAAAEIAAAPPASCTAQLHCDEQRTGSCQPAPTEAKRMQSIDCVSPQPAQSDSSQRVLSESRRSPAEDTGVNTHIAVAELTAEPSSACATLGPDTARIVPALKDQDGEFPRPIDRLVAACRETKEEMDHGADDMAEDDAVIAGLDSNARAGAATGESDKQTSPGETTDSAKEEHAHPRVHSQAVSTHEPPTGGCTTAAPEQEPRGVLKKTRGSEAPAPVEQIVPLLPPLAAGAPSLTKDAQAQAVHFPGAAVGSGTSLPPLQHGALAPPTTDGSAPLAPSLCLFRMLSAARDTRDAAARAARAEDRDDLAEALAAYGQASEAAGTYMHYHQELITQATTPGAMDPNDCGGVKSVDTPLADASKQFSLLTSVVLSSRQVFGERAEVIRHLAAEYAYDVVPQPQVVTMQAIGRGESCDGNDRSSPGINQTTLAWKDANGSELDGGPIMVPVTRPHGGYAFYQPNAAISNGGYDPDYDSQYADVAQQSLHEPVVTFEDISGLDELKTELYESVVLPGVWPEAYAAPLRAASVAVLLHGPPGTGKSMLAEAAANEGGLRMLLVKPSVVLSKYFGDSEKDGNSDDTASRRLLCELLLQLNDLRSERSSHTASRSAGARDSKPPHVVVLAATNDIRSLDEAFLRRFDKRLAVPIPGEDARCDLITHMLSTGGVEYELTAADIAAIACETNGYSGSDLRCLCRHAAMAPVREAVEQCGMHLFEHGLDDSDRCSRTPSLRPLLLSDFMAARNAVPASTAKAPGKASTTQGLTLPSNSMEI